MNRESELAEAVKKLKGFDFVHSIVLFGSFVTGKTIRGKDIDLCIIFDPCNMPSNKQFLKLAGELPERFDLSFFHLLPIHIRKKIFSSELSDFSEFVGAVSEFFKK